MKNKIAGKTVLAHLPTFALVTAAALWAFTGGTAQATSVAPEVGNSSIGVAVLAILGIAALRRAYLRKRTQASTRPEA